MYCCYCTAVMYVLLACMYIHDSTVPVLLEVWDYFSSKEREEKWGQADDDDGDDGDGGGDDEEEARRRMHLLNKEHTITYSTLIFMSRVYNTYSPIHAVHYITLHVYTRIGAGF